MTQISSDDTGFRNCQKQSLTKRKGARSSPENLVKDAGFLASLSFGLLESADLPCDQVKVPDEPGRMAMDSNASSFSIGPIVACCRRLGIRLCMDSDSGLSFKWKNKGENRAH